MNEQDLTSADILSVTPGWIVRQCAHGCLHVQLGRLVLKFTPEELHRLVTLVGGAYVRLSVREEVDLYTSMY